MLPLCLQEAGRGPDESGGPTGVPVRTPPPQHAASQAVSLASPLLFSSALSAPFRNRRNLLTIPHKQVYFLHARVDDRQTEEDGGGNYSLSSMIFSSSVVSVPSSFLSSTSCCVCSCSFSLRCFVFVESPLVAAIQRKVVETSSNRKSSYSTSSYRKSS